MSDLLYRARILRQQIESMAEDLSDESAAEYVELFHSWSSGVVYAVGQRVRYEGLLYKCLTAHTSQDTWTPDDAHSLWAKVLIEDPEVISSWEQPDSTNPYMAGDKVTHADKTWVSDIDNNVWEPGVYGWSEFTE